MIPIDCEEDMKDIIADTEQRGKSDLRNRRSLKTGKPVKLADLGDKMERATGLEPATLSLGS